MLGPGVDFGAYRVLGEIGRGGMAVVFEAEHRGLQKRVALKVLHTPEGLAEQRFLREGLAAARIHHEHIVEVFDSGVQDGTAYLVMERLRGESLASLLRREGPLDAERVADLMLPVVSALAAAHAADVVHRDVKPENIHLSRSRRDEVVPKLVDFGLARLHALDGDAQRLTGSAALVGTVTHISPEQVLDPEAVTAASDQYALGVVMYECVTGKLPVQGPSVFATLNAILKGRFARPRECVPTLDPRLDELIVRAMARDARDRFPNVNALGAALLPMASRAARDLWTREFGDASSAGPTSPSAPAPSGGARTGSAPRLARAWPMLLLALAAGAAWVALRRPEAPLSPAARVTAAPPATVAAPPATVAAPAPATVAAPAPATVAAPSLRLPPTPDARESPPRHARSSLPRRPSAPAVSAVTPPAPAQGDASAPAAPWMLRTQF